MGSLATATQFVGERGCSKLLTHLVCLVQNALCAFISGIASASLCLSFSSQRSSVTVSATETGRYSETGIKTNRGIRDTPGNKFSECFGVEVPIKSY